MITFPLKLDDSLHKKVKIKAVETGQTLHGYIVNLIEVDTRNGEINDNKINLERKPPRVQPGHLH